MSTNEIIKDINLPGVHLYKSMVSNQYFTGMKIEDTPETVANITKFTHTELTSEEYESIKNSNKSFSSDGKHVDFYLKGKRLQSIRIGSYVMRNMFGVLLIVTEQNFKDTFVEVTGEDVKEILKHYFLISVFIKSYNNKESDHYITSIELETYKAYPSQKRILDYCNNEIKYVKKRRELGYKVIVNIINIQELTKEQYDAYRSID